MIYIASFFMLLLLTGMVGYLTFIPVPADNKELIVTILGVLLGGGAAAMPNLFGDKEGETSKLKEQIARLEAQMAEQRRVHDVQIASLQTALDTTKAQYDQIVSMLIDRHVVRAEGIDA